MVKLSVDSPISIKARPKIIFLQKIMDDGGDRVVIEWEKLT